MWLFLTLIISIVPVGMIVMGRTFLKIRPSETNSRVYYRTERAMMTSETKRYAHKICGRYCFKTGVRLLFVVIILGLILLRHSLKIYEPTCGIILIIEMAMLLFAVPLTEYALEKKFGARSRGRMIQAR